MPIQNERRPLDHLKSFAAWCHLIYLMKNYLTERFSYDLEMKTREQNRNNKPTERERLACSKRSDSGERCEVKKAMKSRGGLGREVLLLPRFYFFALLFTSHRSPLSERLEQARVRFDWFIERIQTRVAFDWLRECSGKKTSSRELSRNLTIIRFDVILQHDWPIEQSPLHISFFFLAGKRRVHVLIFSSIG